MGQARPAEALDLRTQLRTRSRDPKAEHEDVVVIGAKLPLKLCALAIPGMIDREAGHLLRIASIAPTVGACELTELQVPDDAGREAA